MFGVRKGHTIYRVWFHMLVPKIPDKCPYDVEGDSPPHRIVVLPLEVFDTNFRIHSVPVVLCAFCDGSAHEAAVKAHDKRS